MPRRSLRRAGPRRKLVWARTQNSFTLSSVALPALSAPVRHDALAQFVQAYGASLIGTTVVRVRGILNATGNGAVAQSVTIAAYIGDANDIVRGPNANDNYYDSNSRGKDYFMVEPFFIPPTTASTVLFPNETQGRVVDVKAMRKLDEVSQRLVIDASPISGALQNNNTFNLDLSILLMLP